MRPSKLPASRHPVEYATTLIIQGKSVEGKSLNLSASGMRLQIPNGMPVFPGQLLGVHLKIGEQHERCSTVQAGVRIIWRRGQECGVQIIRLRPDCAALYTDVINGYAFLMSLSPRVEVA